MQRPPHPATVVQRNAKHPGQAGRPPHPATVLQRATAIQREAEAVPTFEVSYSKWPNIANHTHEYIESCGGDTVTLTYMAEKALSKEEQERFAKIGDLWVQTNRDKNRWNTKQRGMHSGKIKKPSGGEYELDEFPYASTYEGGTDASVFWVLKTENASQGATLGAFYKEHKMADGARFKVKVVD